MEFDVGELWEVRNEHPLGELHHDVAAKACGHSAQNQDILDVQILAVLRDSVAHVDADALVDLACLRLCRGVLHRGLDFLEALRVMHVAGAVHVGVVRHHVLRQVDPSRLREPGRRTLAQVHGGVAPVGGPDIPRALWVEVEGVVRVLVDPARERAVRVNVARALAASEGDSKKAALADHLAAGNSCDLSVVDDLDGHVAELVPRDVLEDWNHLLLVHIRGHVREAVAPCCLTVCRNGTGGTATDGDNGARKLGSNVLHGLDDDVIVVLRIRVGDVPLSLLGVQDLAVLHGDRLDVALAKVEGDAAATRHLATDDRLVLAGGQLLGLHNIDRPWDTIDLRHRRGLEGILAALAVRGFQQFADLGRTRQHQLEAAPLPDHVPDALAREEHGCVEALMRLREHRQLVAAHAAPGPLDCKVQLGDGTQL
mmetsp:Transcript_57081/g.149550  ORF Transcript_57081/g.149550 Transcript_57081/m.149550 type:complete len:426 (+) Transcript_57081:278-1555(+)